MMDNNNMASMHNTVTLQLLGGIIEVRCLNKRCLEGIKSFFSASIVQPWTTPDVIIYCNWEESGRYLFRTSPSNKGDEPILKGVFYKEKGMDKFSEWDSFDPPLPPFVKKPFVNSYVGLHAGAIKGKKNEAILLIGERGSGKTTSTLELVNNTNEYSLITDETVFIRNRSCVVEPFPRLVLPRKLIDGSVHKDSVPAVMAYKSIATSSALISHGFILIRGVGAPFIKPLSNLEAYRNIIEHYKFAGTELEDSMLTLAMITKTVPFSLINHSSYEDLLYIIKTIPSYLEQKSPLPIKQQ